MLTLKELLDQKPLPEKKNGRDVQILAAINKLQARADEVRIIYHISRCDGEIIITSTDAKLLEEWRAVLDEITPRMRVNMCTKDGQAMIHFGERHLDDIQNFDRAWYHWFDSIKDIVLA